MVKVSDEKKDQISVNASLSGMAIAHDVDVVIFEQLDLGGKKRGSYLHNGVEKYHYSIGARYLIREIIKSLPEMVGLEVLAKVPEAFPPYLT